MPDPVSPAQAILETLGFVFFTREESGALRLSSQRPDWLRQLWPQLERDDFLPLADASPFLENFLIDAEECWKNAAEARAESGPWIEQNNAGEPVELQATAMTAAGRSILLLERLGESFAAKKAILQQARETVIAHQRLNSEIQKKEILLHCVADEMTAALANIITSLRLIELEKNTPRTQTLLGLATRATEEQQTLIHRILGVFEEELRAVCNIAADEAASARWGETLRRALDSVRPLFDEKGIRLETTDASANLTLAIDPAKLERVLANLLENALERSAPGGAVLVRPEEETEALLVSIEDGGAMLAPRDYENVFARFNPLSAATPAALRLHFCRIVLDNSGGEIGCTAVAPAGNRFWARLPKQNKPDEKARPHR